MIIDNLYVVRAIIPPLKADPPLLVDSDAVLSLTIALQDLKAVARQRRQIAQGSRTVKNLQATLRLDDKALKASGAAAFVKRLRILVTK